MRISSLFVMLAILGGLVFTASSCPHSTRPEVAMLNTSSTALQK